MKQAQIAPMTDAAATVSAPDSAPPVSARLDDNDPPWPLRPWIMAAIAEKIRVLPEGRQLPAEALNAIDVKGQCSAAPCAAYMLSDDRLVLITRGNIVFPFARDPRSTEWRENYRGYGRYPVTDAPRTDPVEKAVIEVRTIQRRQVFVNGKPLGEDFE